MRKHPAAQWLAVALLATLSSCGGDASPDTAPISTADQGDPAPTEPTASTESAPTSTQVTADPTTTNPPGDDGNGQEVTRGTLEVSPTAVRVGDEITVQTSCPYGDLTADIWFDDYSANHLAVIAPSTNIDAAIVEYETTATIPYFLSPGVSSVHAGCLEGAGDPEPVEIEILPSLNGYDELWRPIQYPWVEPDRQPGTPPPLPSDESYAEGYGIGHPVHALCDAGIPRSGARFVVWVSTVTDDDFIAVEYPVADDGYDPIDQGVVISADIVVDLATFTADDRGGDAPRISALCVPTATPFTPEAEPETPRLVVLGV